MQHLFLLMLTIVGIYSLSRAAIIMKRLHSLANHQQNEDCTFVRQSLVVLDAQCTNLRQVLWATFYLFGFLFFIGLQSAIDYLGSGVASILGMFVVNFAFAANVFLVFLVLHLLQFLVSVRVRAYAKRLTINPT